MTQLNVAVVGLRFGRTWVNGFRNHPDCRVLTLCDINADVLQQNATDAAIPSTSSDLDDVLSDPAIDVVALFTPAPLHAEQSARSLRAGKHVLSAVPAAVTVDGCREIVMAAKESGRTYMMAENWPYEPSVLKAKSFYDSGNIGTLFYGEAEYIHHTESLWFSADGEPTWRHTLAPLLYPTHGLGPYLHMTGDRFTEVTAHSVSGDIAPGTEPGRSWLELAVLRSERGILFKLLNSFCNAHPGGHYLSLYGDKGSFESGRGKKARSQAFAWSLGDEPREMAEEMHEYPPLPDYAQNMGSHAGPAVQIIDDFVSAILEGRPAPIGPELAVNMTLPGIAAVESIQKNRTVSVANPADWL